MTRSQAFTIFAFILGVVALAVMVLPTVEAVARWLWRRER